MNRASRTIKQVFLGGDSWFVMSKKGIAPSATAKRILTTSSQNPTADLPHKQPPEVSPCQTHRSPVSIRFQSQFQMNIAEPVRYRCRIFNPAKWLEKLRLPTKFHRLQVHLRLIYSRTFLLPTFLLLVFFRLWAQYTRHQAWVSYCLWFVFLKSKSLILTFIESTTRL